MNLIKLDNVEDLKWSKEKLQIAREFTNNLGTGAVIILENDKIIAEWGKINSVWNFYSVRKSFMSCMIGIAVDQGKLNLDSTLAELNIDDIPSLTKKEKHATVRDLLESRSGVYHYSNFQTQDDRDRMPKREAFEHGEHWYYNNWDFNVLCTIYQKAMNSDFFLDFQKYIAKPLGFENWTADGLNSDNEKMAEYIIEDNSIHPAYIFRISAKDLAKFGLVYLYKGNWHGTQIVSEKWVNDSTKIYSMDENDIGYGYMWWVSNNGKLFPNIKLTDGFAATGNRGHYLVVLPYLDLVIVHRYDNDRLENKYVSSKQFGTLLKLIIEAKLY